MQRIALIVFLPALLSACASSGFYQVNLMPAPAVFDEALFNPLIDSDDVTDAPFQGVPYITDREPAEPDNAEHFYQNARSAAIRVGFGDVSYAGEPLTREERLRISLDSTRDDKIPLQVTGVNELGFLDTVLPFGFLTDPAEIGELEPAGRKFAELIDAKLDLSRSRDIYVYVHGYKVVFENPLLVTAELWHYLSYDGVFLAYAWPSTPKRLAYFKDLETAELTGQNLRRVLEYLAANTSAERIHIVGYSAGTRVVITALHQLAMTRAGRSEAEFQAELRIGQVMLVGSDYDSQKFAAAVADGLLNVPRAFTVYMSATDDALGISRFLFRENRLGELIDEATISPNVRDVLQTSDDIFFVDVTDAERSDSGNGHGYFRQSPWASSDLLMTLAYGLTPAERGLVREDGSLAWSFPADYVDRLRSSAIEADKRQSANLANPGG